jgi:RNA polymerase sigma factor (sigma-70 family)
MTETEILTERFEANRSHLRSVAYRMLGSQTEADDAVQETFLRVMRAGTSGVDNFAGWLTTIVARVCLDMLRGRKSRREVPVDAEVEALPAIDNLEIADSVGVATLVVLETLTPAERVAFVLHDMFTISFDEIAPVIGRSPAAARQLASRGRRAEHVAHPLSLEFVLVFNAMLHVDRGEPEFFRFFAESRGPWAAAAAFAEYPGLSSRAQGLLRSGSPCSRQKLTQRMTAGFAATGGDQSAHSAAWEGVL